MGPGDLSRALAALPVIADPRLLVGRETFDDAGVFRLADDLALVQTVDFFAPIVDDAYAAGANEELVGLAVADRREAAVICTKFGWVSDGHGKPLRLDSSPATVRRACDASLRRLRTDYIDLYLQHRQDPAVPIEETIGELLRLHQEGKVRSIGLCEVTVETLERASAVMPVAALQTEYSLWSREPEAKLLPACQRLGVRFIAYSPLGRGFLSGRIRALDDLPSADFRRTHPRFQDANLAGNLNLVDRLDEIAGRLGDKVKEFVRANTGDKSGDPYAKQMAPLVSRLDGARDWQPAEASGLLADVAAVWANVARH